ncbi:uncharacterized protein BX663DRAFT_517934 [Cokeromyces recurvatus]|uniref:uncharacterized protein n=1 Tax=Cokeromyces recurvatus TaxID=90255 RepID=UPI00221F3D38|nr:uncharacterized protein BX663DRAFT_517934 [Cokeromyces recurvatus]KAI7900529.1 hypothetical protein BX663DRAFT_517934 [Cokeromyces recurvatus]
MRTTLFVAGFGGQTRARDLAYEFERYGRLVRCDIPAPKSFHAKVYAFVEFEDPHDAEDAFNEMHGRRIDGYTISVQWARNAPSASWRLGGPSYPPLPPPLPLPHQRRHPPPHHHHHSLPPPPPGRIPPPPYYHRSYSPYRSRSRGRRRSMSPPRGRSPLPPPPSHYYLKERRYSASPRSRSRSPIPTVIHTTEHRSKSPSRHYH